MDSIFFYRNNEDSAGGEVGLKGLKIAIQPNISVAGWPTDAGSRALANYSALEDATIVQRLRQGGASLCGSTRMSEFGFGLKDSKAGEALRQQQADAEMVMDFTGESRLAACNAGIYGFKPSFGLVSRFGLVGLIPSMECCGVLSGELKNIRKIMEAIAGKDDLDFSLPDEEMPDFSAQNFQSQRMTVGVISEAYSNLPAWQEKMFLSSVEELKRAGFTVREMSMPEFDLFTLVHRIVGSVEASSCAGRYDSVRYGQRVPGAKNWNDMYLLSRGAYFGPLIKSYLFQGAFYQFESYKAYEDACRIRRRLIDEMKKLTSQTDFLILPAISCAAESQPMLLSDLYKQFTTMAFSNVTGQPVLYMPSFPGEGRSGFQLAGPRLSDARLLCAGEYLASLRKGEI